MARTLTTLEIRTRYGGRGVIASAVVDGKRISAQSSIGHQSAAEKLTAMVVFGTCTKNFVESTRLEYEFLQIHKDPDGGTVIDAKLKRGG